MGGLRTNITGGRQGRETEDKVGDPKPKEMGNKTSKSQGCNGFVIKGLK